MYIFISNNKINENIIQNLIKEPSLYLQFTKNINIIDNNSIYLCEYIKGTISNNTILDLFSLEDLKKLNKTFDTSIKLLDYSNNTVLFNINGLIKISFFDTIQYLYEKCKNLNIVVSLEQLLSLHQILYPSYIEIIEKNTCIDEQLDKSEELYILDKPEKLNKTEELNNSEITIIKPKIIWLINKDHCKAIINKRVICCYNTILKKHSVRENKNDPTDKIRISIGTKLKLIDDQNNNFYYKVTF